MTIGFLALLYPWTKAFHFIAVIAWMAGMFYLPRLPAAASKSRRDAEALARISR